MKTRRTLFSRLPAYVILTVLAVAWTVPTLGLLVSSFRPGDDVLTSGWWTVFLNPAHAKLNLDNYRIVLANGQAESARADEGNINLFGSALNSLTVAVPATVLPVLIAAAAAYGFAWIRFPGRKALFAIVIALQVVPLQIALIPILRDFVQLKVNGTFLAVWLAHTGFALPLATYLLFNFISTIPRDLLEVASIDGASHFAIFTELILPVSVPALAAFATLQFLWVWNDLLVALVFLGAQPDYAVLTQRLVTMIGTYGDRWYLLTAGAFISMLLPLVVFFSLQRYFVRGLLAGSIKG